MMCPGSPLPMLKYIFSKHCHYVNHHNITRNDWISPKLTSCSLACELNSIVSRNTWPHHSQGLGQVMAVVVVLAAF